MRLSLCTQHTTEGRLLWSLKTLPQEQRNVLVQWEGKGRESQNTENFASATTTSPPSPAPIHQSSGPPCPSLTVPYCLKPQLQTGMSSGQAAPARSPSRALCAPEPAVHVHGQLDLSDLL